MPGKLGFGESAEFLPESERVNAVAESPASPASTTHPHYAKQADEPRTRAPRDTREVLSFSTVRRAFNDRVW